MGGKNQNGACKNTERCHSLDDIKNPVAIASGKDGSVYLGDGERIKKIVPDKKHVAVILELELDYKLKIFFHVFTLCSNKYSRYDKNSNNLMHQNFVIQPHLNYFSRSSLQSHFYNSTLYNYYHHFRYHLTLNPMNGKLYITEPRKLQILRVKTMGTVRDLKDNFEVVAGTGMQCYPGDSNLCGDGGQAVQSKLIYPKGDRILKAP